MAKKKINYLIPGAIALVLGIAAFCMMFLPAVIYTADFGLAETSYSYTGMQITFGYSETIGSGALSATATILSFNFLGLLAFGLPLIGGILALIFKNGLIGKIVTTACFVVGAVLIFSIVGYATVGMSDAQKTIVENLNAAMGAGAIAGGIIAIVGAVVCFFKGTIAKMFK